MSRQLLRDELAAGFEKQQLKIARRRREWATFWHGERRLGRVRLGQASMDEILEAQGHFAQAVGVPVEETHVTFGEEGE